MNDSTARTRAAATGLLEGLRRRGVHHVFANAGTDFAPIIEALVAAGPDAPALPRFHTVPHENVAVAMAHGYYAACGEPAAVMVHVTVGTANALCGIMNASRDSVPVLLFAGRTPNTETGHAGSRNASIHWGQDSFDQGGMLREYVKWDYELRAGQSVDSIVERAVDIAMSEPRGPVYLVMPRELLGDADLPPGTAFRERLPGAVPAVPDREAMRDIARRVAESAFPVIMTANLGRTPGNFERLSRLAETWAIAVGYPGEPGPRSTCVASDHPMNIGDKPMEALAEADLVLVMDCEVPWWPRFGGPGARAKVIHVAPDPLFSRYPLRGFPCDMAVAGSTARALEMLEAELAAIKADPAIIDKRRARIGRYFRDRQERIRAALTEHAHTTPIHPAWVAACINQVKGEEALVINELGVPRDLLYFSRPGTYLSNSSAGGLGFGLGASLGARLGAPDRDVLLIVGDGSYLFGNPVSTHFVARAEGLPTLTVVMNNGRWHAVDRSTRGMYPDGQAAVAELMPLVALAPSPDYEKIIQACGGIGERVKDPAALLPALQRAMKAVRSGTPALVNVIVGTG